MIKHLPQIKYTKNRIQSLVNVFIIDCTHTHTHTHVYSSFIPSHNLYWSPININNPPPYLCYCPTNVTIGQAKAIVYKNQEFSLNQLTCVPFPTLPTWQILQLMECFDSFEARYMLPWFSYIEIATKVLVPIVNYMCL